MERTSVTPPLPTLRVLGVPALTGPDGEPITFRTRKHFALLIYLALEPQVHRREKLASLLWPDATTAEARHSLATGLSVLRGKLGREHLETTRDTARLLPGSVELDLDRLARGEIHATETQGALAVAPLMQEFVVPDALPWDHWREALAAKWQPAIREALLARIERSRRQGNTRTMEVLADALLILDDLSEEGVRAKMESRAFAGDRLTALQIYEDWRVRLADELGAEPSDLVAGMALRLRRRGWERTSGEHIPSVRTDQWKDRPFVGRAKEYEVLYEGWEGCQRGTSRHVLLTGESGVGKSTLVERLTTAAGLQGATTARVQCHEVEREIPYGAIGALAGHLLERPGASAVAPEWLSELSRTVSSVRRRFPNVAAPPEATGEMVRIRLADALHELVRAIAEEQPLILVMDDIHLGDDASVSVMHLLLRRLTDERVVVFCTLRQTDGHLGPSARGMMERAELAQMSIVALPPLTDAETLELLDQLLPAGHDQPPPTVRRALLRAATGLPMLVELLVRDWQGHGDRCVALAVQAMTEEPGAAGGAGETYRRILDRLTVGLDPNTRSVLNLAAILGSQLNEFELYRLVDLTLAQAMAGLSQLAALRILRDGGHGLEFVNEVMRGEVYFAVPSSVRKALHSKVADRLIERAEGGEAMLGLAIAWHCMRSGRVPEAGEWLIRGGREAIARSALAEAEEALESGAKHLPRPHCDECGLLLIDVLMDQGRYREAHKLGTILSEELSESSASRLGDLLELSSAALGLGWSGRTRESLASALSIARTHEQADHRLRAAALAASIASVAQRDLHHEQVLSVLEEALKRAPPHHVTRYDLLIAQAYYLLRRLDECEAILARLDASLLEDGPALQEFNLRVGQGACSAARGKYDASINFARRAAQIARKAGAPGKERTALSNEAVCQLRLGRYREALDLARKAQILADESEVDAPTIATLGVGLCASALLGDDARHREYANRLRPISEQALEPAMALVASLWLADGLAVGGDGRGAREVAMRALGAPGGLNRSYAGIMIRWAHNLLQHTRLPEFDALIQEATGQLARLDTLDRFEVGTVAIATQSLSVREQSEIRAVANAAEGILPAAATGLSRRLMSLRR